MGDMLVAYEDDVPKDRGLKVSGHCALDTGLGCANTFAPYCMMSTTMPDSFLIFSVDRQAKKSQKSTFSAHDIEILEANWLLGPISHSLWLILWSLHMAMTPKHHIPQGLN